MTACWSSASRRKRPSRAASSFPIPPKKSRRKEVIAVGAGKIEKGERVPMDVKPGDRILFGKYSGTEIKLDNEEFLILREEEILAKLGAAAKVATSKR